MGTEDPHNVSHRLDEATAQRLIERLESRARDAAFCELFHQYIAALNLPDPARVLELGCGTGAMARALAARPDFSGTVVGLDQSPAFIAAARRLAVEDGVAESVEFAVGDAHAVGLDDECADAVIAHTVISHVSEPAGLLREMARLVRRGGSVVVFDGDYASLTYACPDAELGRRMDRALSTLTYRNPLVMRELVRLLPGAGLALTATLANVLAEIGSASYFRSFAETYAPMVVASGLLPAEEVERWLALQRAAMEDGTFFASCNYYAYLARRA